MILARRIAETITRIEPDAAPALAGALDVTMYRDDLGRTPRAHPRRRTCRPAASTARRSCSSTTCSTRAAPSVRLSTRSPTSGVRRVRLAALVDRGHREFPIRADFVGKNLPSSTRERINVRLAEIDGDDAVTIDGGTLTRPARHPWARSRDGRRAADVAEDMSAVQEREVKKLPTLRGKTVVNLFFEDSTRTRTSFEAAAKRLWADVINFSARARASPRARA